MSITLGDLVGFGLAGVALLYVYILRRANARQAIPAWTRSETLAMIHVTFAVSLFSAGIALLI